MVPCGVILPCNKCIIVFDVVKPVTTLSNEHKVGESNLFYGSIFLAMGKRQIAKVKQK